MLDPFYKYDMIVYDMVFIKQVMCTGLEIYHPCKKH